MPVSIALTGDTAEGTIAPMMLTFDATTWNEPQTVTVTGVNDTLRDGNQLYYVIGDPSGSADADYAALTPFTVEVTNADND